MIQFGPMVAKPPGPMSAERTRSTSSQPRSTPAAAARAWSSGARPAPRRRRAASRARSTGRGRLPASATRTPGLRSSALPRRRTAPTAPAGCSPATAPATGSTPPCTAPATRTSPSRAGARTACACATPTSPRSSAAPRPPTGRRRPSATTAFPTWRASSSCSSDCRTIVALGAFAWDGTLRALRALGDRGAAAEAPIRPRRRGRRRRLEAARLLPPQPAEHLHRPPHRADARRDLRPGPRAEWLRAATARRSLPASRREMPAIVSKEASTTDTGIPGSEDVCGARSSAPGSPGSGRGQPYGPHQFLPAPLVDRSARSGSSACCAHRRNRRRARSISSSMICRSMSPLKVERIGAGIFIQSTSSKWRAGAQGS